MRCGCLSPMFSEFEMGFYFLNDAVVSEVGGKGGGGEGVLGVGGVGAGGCFRVMRCDW